MCHPFVFFIKKTGQIPASFCLFSSFSHDTHQYKLIKAQMVCMGVESGATGWKAQTNPLSYGGTPLFVFSYYFLLFWTRYIIWCFFFTVSIYRGHKMGTPCLITHSESSHLPFFLSFFLSSFLSHMHIHMHTNINIHNLLSRPWGLSYTCPT